MWFCLLLLIIIIIIFLFVCWFCSDMTVCVCVDEEKEKFQCALYVQDFFSLLYFKHTLLCLMIWNLIYLRKILKTKKKLFFYDYWLLLLRLMSSGKWKMRIEREDSLIDKARRHKFELLNKQCSDDVMKRFVIQNKTLINTEVLFEWFDVIREQVSSVRFRWNKRMTSLWTTANMLSIFNYCLSSIFQHAMSMMYSFIWSGNENDCFT